MPPADALIIAVQTAFDAKHNKMCAYAQNRAATVRKRVLYLRIEARNMTQSGTLKLVWAWF